MPKIKPPRKNPVIDMTAMCDVSFLLLTFFILTAKFKPTSVVAVDLPSSRSSKAVQNVCMITVNKDGRAFLSLKETTTRYAMLEQMTEKYGEKYPQLKQLTPQQKNFFALVETWGTPIQDIQRVLSMDGTEFKNYQDKQMPGIPYDSLHSELGDWVQASRYATEGDIKIGIKGDKDVSVQDIKQVINRLTEKDIHRFLLITTLTSPDHSEADEAKAGAEGETKTQ